MSAHVESIVGTARTAQLIDAYASRLMVMDLLPQAVAKATACEAYADACVYVVSAPGQLWRGHWGVAAQGDTAYILNIDIDDTVGHYALCLDKSSRYIAIPLQTLDALYELVSWPDSGSGGA